jgi:signal transduction histidine kinase/DNA-binding response OmpR family regulator
MDNKQFPVPENERERLKALRRYNILDTLEEDEFDDVTKLVTYICRVPIAHVSFIDKDRQWFKSEIGVGVKEVPREISFCQHTILQDELVEIPDTHLNEQYKDDPNVTGGFNVRFYAGIPLTTPDGYNIGTICAVDHVKKELNEAQKNVLSILAKHIINRLELKSKNIELDEQKKIAELAVKAKDSFLANMSHEIRTPLNAIIGFTDLLAQSELDALQQDYISNVQVAGENLLMIVNDILDLSKIESGHLTIDEQPFDLKKALKHVYNLLKVKVSKDIDFNLFLDADLPDMVVGDKGRLNQILVNLAGNAVKFTPDGEITISVKHVESTATHHRLKFSVKDTGIGIPEDKLKTIFDRFTQAEESTTRKFGGTGLGLNIVKQLVELQRGEIHVKSQPGRGSEFFFVLDYKKSANIETAIEEKTSVKLGRLKILLCEDNVLNQKLATSVISGFGFDLDIANNGEEGIELLVKNNYDVVLMDLQMPIMDGYQTTEFIRKDLKKDIPIIAMTAHSLVGEQEKCFNTGMDGYVPKPFKQADLLEAIRSVFAKSKESRKIIEIDYSYLDEMSGGNEAFLMEMIGLFVTKTPEETATLKKGIAEKNYDTVKKTAHNMRSSLGMFNLDDLTECLLIIEAEAMQGEFTMETQDRFEMFECGIDGVINALKIKSK